MLSFEEELKKFEPVLEVDDAEEEALQEDLTDVIDLFGTKNQTKAHREDAAE